MLERAGNGAYITSCLQHNGADVASGGPAGPEWRFVSGLAGAKTLSAIFSWWEAPPDAPATEHTHTSTCSLSTHAPYECNPSCRTEGSKNQMPKRVQIDAILKAGKLGACRSDSTCEPNLRVGPVPEELVNEWALYSRGGGSWVRARGLVGSWARG